MLDFNSASSLKQQSAGRNVVPLGDIILLPNQPIFALSAGKPVTQESSLDVFCHVIFDVNIDVMDVRGRPQEFVAL